MASVSRLGFSTWGMIFAKSMTILSSGCRGMQLSGRKSCPLLSITYGASCVDWPDFSRRNVAARPG